MLSTRAALNPITLEGSFSGRLQNTHPTEEVFIRKDDNITSAGRLFNPSPPPPTKPARNRDIIDLDNVPDVYAINDSDEDVELVATSKNPERPTIIVDEDQNDEVVFVTSASTSQALGSSAPASQPPVPVSQEEPQSDDDIFSICVARVLEIVPDVEPAFLAELVEKHFAAHKLAAVEQVLNVLFEDVGYPRVGKKGKGKRKAEDDPEREREAEMAMKKLKIDYASVERTHVGGENYSGMAMIQLQVDFPYVPLPYIRQALNNHYKFYTPTYLYLQSLQQQHDEHNVELPYKPKVTAFRPKNKAKEIQSPEFEEERRWLEARKENSVTQFENEPEVKTRSEEQDELEDEDGIECGCCFGTYAFDKLVQCPEAHLFCTTCLQTYVSSTLGAHSSFLTCIHVSGCNLPFPDSELQRVLPEKLWSLYERVKQQKELEAAEIVGLEQCPWCEWQCVIENPDEKLFRCGNEQCGAVSCRACREPEHLPKSCKEAEESRTLEGRHTIEEAMSSALMRKCPKCRKPFLKESGCNMMTCPCGTSSCYICQQEIRDYTHFEKNKDCANSAGASQVINAQVKVAKKKAIEQYLREHPELKEEDLKVDDNRHGSKLKSPAKRAGKYY